MVVSPLEVPLDPIDLTVPGEMSVAVYWLVVGCVHPDADITIRRVCLNPRRTGIIDALRQMGARIDVLENYRDDVEPVGDLRVRSSQLSGIRIGSAMVPRMIDEFPGFVLAAALADGETMIEGAQELRTKKSDRIAAVAQEYSRLGAQIEVRPDGMVITGVRSLRRASCHARGDHRLATSLAVAGLVSEGGNVVNGAELIATVSYPAFVTDIARLTGEQPEWIPASQAS